MIECEVFNTGNHLVQDCLLEGHSLLGKLVKIPTGSFNMGSDNGYCDEEPIHEVMLKSFWMQEAPVTFAQWDYFVKDSGCNNFPNDQGWGRGERPVINVSYHDITEHFLPWLNRITGKKFRLPSEAEWEYACRAGTTTKYSWGDDISPSHANYAGSKHGKTVPVKSYAPNAFGLYDMHGNVWEWTQDCWNDNYIGAPDDGSAWQEGRCEWRVLRGGSWDYPLHHICSAVRMFDVLDSRLNHRGFRLVCNDSK